MKILFFNHSKSQCGVYEIGKRIHELLNKNILSTEYKEIPVDNPNTYLEIMEESNPDIAIYNYFTGTLPYINKSLFTNFSKTKHVGIIHDPLSPHDIDFYNNNFDAWIIHDPTNPIISNKKFTTIRPIRRFNKIDSINNIPTFGSHGFNVSPWKRFDSIINIIQSEFDEAIINFNITKATFGQNNESVFDYFHSIIKKPKIYLNITNEYFDSEIELINFLSKNDLNIYFYFPPHGNVGVGGSADLAVSSQTGLVVNSTYMYRHFHEHIGFFEQNNNLKYFIENKHKTKDLYEKWHPDAMTIDYKNMIEKII
jgi:hypothetical protein